MGLGIGGGTDATRERVMVIQARREGYRLGAEVAASSLIDAGLHTLGLVPIMQLSDPDIEKFSTAMRLLDEVHGSLVDPD